MTAITVAAAAAAGCSTARHEAGSASGGQDAARAWHRLPDPPLSPRTHAVVVGFGDRMVVVGGWEFFCPPMADCAGPEAPLFDDGAVYDRATDAWTDHGPVPGPGHYRRLVALGQTLLAYSGSDERGEVADWILDPDRASWTELPDDPLPSAFDRFVAPVGDQLVLAGSSRAALDSGENDGKLAASFDRKGGTWTSSRMPRGRDIS